MARADVAALRAFELGNLPLHPPRTDRLVGSLHWGAGVSASLPLFEGGGRRTARTRASRDVDELRLRRRSIAERIEQRVRSAAHLAGASFAGIELAEAATVEARQNLDLVASACEQGVMPILRSAWWSRLVAVGSRIARVPSLRSVARGNVNKIQVGAILNSAHPIPSQAAARRRSW